MNLPKDLEAIYWNEDEGWREVDDTSTIVNHGRWTVTHRKVFEEVIDPNSKGLPRYLAIFHDSPATESQDGMEREYKGKWVNRTWLSGEAELVPVETIDALAEWYKAYSRNPPKKGRRWNRNYKPREAKLAAAIERYGLGK